MDMNERRKINRLLRRPNPLGTKVSAVNRQKNGLLRGTGGGARYTKTHQTVAEAETNKQLATAQANKQTGFHVDLTKLCADMCGVSSLSNAAAQAITRHLNQVASLLIDNIIRVMEQSLRGVPQSYDVDIASVMIGLEPSFGTGTVNFLPIRTGGRTAAASSCGPGGKVFYIRPDKEIDIKALLSREPAGVVYDVTLAAHWLAVNGKQPTTPQNPPPDFISRMNLLNGATARRRHQLQLQQNPATKERVDAPATGKLTGTDKAQHPFKSRQLLGVDSSPASPPDGHGSSRSQELSAVTVGRRPHQVGQEMMVYFRELTEACVGASENRRHEALENVTMDPGLQPLLPYLITFITEGVRVNVMNHNLAILIYLMRLVKALVDNGHISLEPYLHLLVPTVITCVLSRQLCAKPITDNHWALRDFAAKQLATLCNRYNSPTNELYNRVTRELARALCQWIDGGSGLSGTGVGQQTSATGRPPTAGVGDSGQASAGRPPTSEAAADATSTRAPCILGGEPLSGAGGLQTGGKRLRILGSAVQSMNTLYGLLVALSEFGAQCLRILVFPLLPALCQRLAKLTSGGGIDAGNITYRLSPADQRSFDSLKAMMSSRIASLLADWRVRQNAGSSAEDYRSAYGALADCLHTANRPPHGHLSVSRAPSTAAGPMPLVVVSCASGSSSGVGAGATTAATSATTAAGGGGGGGGRPLLLTCTTPAAGSGGGAVKPVASSNLSRTDSSQQQ